jgi:predicted RNase H-like nuclease (RuvC/YqgF family)
VQPPQASALVQSLFHSRNNELKGEVEDTRAARAREEAERQQAEKLAALEEEIKKFQSERSELGRLKNELQVAAARLESERASFERQKATDLATLQEQRDEAARLQKREKSVLEKQRKVSDFALIRYGGLELFRSRNFDDIPFYAVGGS